MYWIITSLYRTHIRKTEISISNSLIKRDLNPFVFVVVPDLHAASRGRHFELSYEKLSSWMQHL